MRKVLLLLATACAGTPDDLAPGRLEAPLGATVESMVTGSCTTTSVWGLSEQVVQMMNCLNPGSMAEVTAGANVSFGAAVFPFMQAPARDAFEAAAASKPGTTLGVNSMLRTVVQQYLLYRWYQAGTCGIGLAATPGKSNHESGLAFDTSNATTWRTTLEAKGFKWLGSSDPVHFDYTGAGALNLTGEDVRAFQVLWNVKNPGDLIDEDGLYGPQTGARIKLSPADGFSGGVTCPGTTPPPADVWTAPPEDTTSPADTVSVADTATPDAQGPADGSALDGAAQDAVDEVQDNGDTSAGDGPTGDAQDPDTNSADTDGPGAPTDGEDVQAPSSDVQGAGQDVGPTNDAHDARPIGTVLPGGGCSSTTGHSATPAALIAAAALLLAFTRRRFG